MKHFQSLILSGWWIGVISNNRELSMVVVGLKKTAEIPERLILGEKSQW
jgi:hypothetical protein